MAFLKKEVMLAEAERLGIDISDMSWPDAQKAVQEAIRNDGMSVNQNGDIVDEPKPDINQIMEENDEIQKLKDELKELKEMFSKKNAVHDDTACEPSVNMTGDDDIPDVNVRIAHEIPATRIQLIKYDEPLGDDLVVEEESFSPGNFNNDVTTGTYRVKGKTGKRVIAQSTIPKINAGITYNPSKDWVPVVTYDKKSGYLFKSSVYPSVKGLLLQSGYWNEYADMFDSTKYPNNIWYAANKMLVCSIPLVHHIFDEIERKAKARKW